MLSLLFSLVAPNTQENTGVRFMKETISSCLGCATQLAAQVLFQQPCENADAPELTGSMPLSMLMVVVFPGRQVVLLDVQNKEVVVSYWLVGDTQTFYQTVEDPHLVWDLV